MGGGPLPQKGEPVPPPYNIQLPGGVPPQPGYVPAQQPPQQYGGQYNQGYQPGPQPVMAGPPVQQVNTSFFSILSLNLKLQIC